MDPLPHPAREYIILLWGYVYFLPPWFLICVVLVCRRSFLNYLQNSKIKSTTQKLRNRACEKHMAVTGGVQPVVITIILKMAKAMIR